MVGRLPRLSFRGLLSVHSRFGLHLRQVATATFSTEDSDGFVASAAASIAAGWNDPCRTGLSPVRRQTPFQGVHELSKNGCGKGQGLSTDAAV